MADTVILTSAVGYDPARIEPFLHSLRRSGYRGDLVLFADAALIAGLREQSKRLRITLVRVPPWRWPSWSPLWGRSRQLLWRCLRVSSRARRAGLVPEASVRWLLGLVYFPIEARFARYRSFLDASPYARVLICDARDVLFQHDPFTDLPTDGLAVGLETDRYTIATEPHNAAWVLRAFGPEMLGRIGHHRVSCAGVTYGDAAAMQRYLSLMASEVSRISPRQIGDATGFDQGVHNVLLWTGRLGTVQMLPTLESTVATLNAVTDEEIRFSAEGRCLNRDDSEPSIVHQYDRVPSLRFALAERLAGVEPTASEPGQVTGPSRT